MSEIKCPNLVDMSNSQENSNRKVTKFKDLLRKNDFGYKTDNW